MMNSRRRQMLRLERLARPAIEKKQEAVFKMLQEVAFWFQQDALTHACNLSLLIVFGNPKEGEPLLRSWDRCLASGAPELVDALPKLEGLSPFDDPFDARWVAEVFRTSILPKLEIPGSSDAEKAALAPLVYLRRP
jgi:hypothetical protein